MWLTRYPFTQNKKCVIFYGSQTGTAEDYGTRIAKEIKSRYGISSLVCDPEECVLNPIVSRIRRG
jgi:NADPH-ferrihemoprotein reductase